MAIFSGTGKFANVKFELEVAELAKKGQPSPPSGNKKPEKTVIQATQYVRRADVVAWVLANAGGACESCGEPAPFQKLDGMPYLEVHYLRRLADGGSDRIENAVAACPNCHRVLHYGDKRSELLKALYEKVDRLDPE